jgi:hypothetical protein
VFGKKSSDNLSSPSTELSKLDDLSEPLKEGWLEFQFIDEVKN